MASTGADTELSQLRAAVEEVHRLRKENQDLRQESLEIARDEIWASTETLRRYVGCRARARARDGIRKRELSNDVTHPRFQEVRPDCESTEDADAEDETFRRDYLDGSKCGRRVMEKERIRSPSG